MTTGKHIVYGILALVSLLGVGITQSAKANLVTNGGFETGHITGWAGGPPYAVGGGVRASVSWSIRAILLRSPVMARISSTNSSRRRRARPAFRLPGWPTTIRTAPRIIPLPSFGVAQTLLA